MVVGYLHIPDMGVDKWITTTILNWERGIIDVRGGEMYRQLSNDWCVNLPMRQCNRQQEGDPNSVGMHIGPKVTLLTNTGFDGDLFPTVFK